MVFVVIFVKDLVDFKLKDKGNTPRAKTPTQPVSRYRNLIINLFNFDITTILKPNNKKIEFNLFWRG